MFGQKQFLWAQHKPYFVIYKSQAAGRNQNESCV